MSIILKKKKARIVASFVLKNNITIHKQGGDISGAPGDVFIIDGDDHYILPGAKIVELYEDAKPEEVPTGSWLDNFIKQIMGE